MSEIDAPEQHGLSILSRQECLDLLSRAAVGRVGLTVDVLPAIFPVNYTLLGEDVVFRTGWGRKLQAATHHQVVCFEVDGFDSSTREGWSVLLTGRAEVIDDGELLARVSDLPLEPWAGGGRDHYVLIRSELLSGRRVGPGAGDAD